MTVLPFAPPRRTQPRYAHDTPPGIDPGAGLSIAIDRLDMEGQTLVAGLALHIPPGAVAVLMGPSGVGKSSVLNAIAGVPSPGLRFRGQVVLNGRDLAGVPTEQRHIGLMFQDPLLFPHLSVRGNLGFAVPRHHGRTARRRMIAEALSDIGLSDFGHRDPWTLSGGEQARVALMRTLLAEPQAVLLDEPFSKLDAALRASFRRMVFDRLSAARLPTLLVTHDPADADAAGGEIVAL